MERLNENQGGIAAIALLIALIDLYIAGKSYLQAMKNKESIKKFKQKNERDGYQAEVMHIKKGIEEETVDKKDQEVLKKAKDEARISRRLG